MDSAFAYVKENPLEEETDYPYKATKGECLYNKSKGMGRVASFSDVKQNDPDQLKAAIAKGPVSVAIQADSFIFRSYSKGVIDSKDCGQNLNHGVLAVGFGNEEGLDYFLVKNSWGPSWGDQGFVRISASADNICGILSSASYPSE
mmetsp:Transcript_17393/g.29263  ORF Transcript_17393/g.29263 Transcript_17393/m.29263 type:complete len:146 (+) Transcript_17393:570-1007(+)